MDGQYRFVQNAFDGSLFGAVEGSGGWAAWAVLLALVALAKCVATAFTVGSGAAGGVLGPSVFIGGTVGAALGAAVEALFPGFLPQSVLQALIPVGMAGVLAGAMRTPLAAMVMVMEMTGSFGLIVPLMLVAMVAYLVGRRWGLIEEQVASSADSPAHAGDAVVHLLEGYRVEEVMDRAWPVRAERRTPLAELLGSLRAGFAPTVPVVERGRLVGLISLTELRHLLEDADLPPVVIAADLMTEPPFLLDPDDSLYEGVSAFQERGLDVIPVVRRNDGVFLGMLTRKDVYAIVKSYMETVRENLLREHAGFAALEEQSQFAHLLSAMALPESGQIDRLAVDRELEGLSLAQADFRNTRRAEVLAIQTRDRKFICPPDPTRPLRAGDFLLVLTPSSRSDEGA
jgi:CIC family chloride channel protein